MLFQTVLVGCMFGMVSTDSIMDIVNRQHIEKIIAGRKENMSKVERWLGQNMVTEEDEVNSDEDIPEDDYLPAPYEPTLNPADVHLMTKHLFHKSHPKPKLHQHKQKERNFTNFPDAFTILADLSMVRGDKLLKSDKNTQLVTKKEYLKKDWCKTEPIVQRIKEDGCQARVILNRFCYGQCNSFYIPKNPPRRKRNHRRRMDEDVEENAPAFKSCTFCKPKKVVWVTINLKCPELVPPFRKRRVQRIKQCKCIAEPV